MDSLLARAEVSKMFNDAMAGIVWPAYFASAPVIYFEGRDTAAPPDPDVPYFRFTFTPAASSQASLAGDTPVKMWEEEGLIVVQSFGPNTSGRGLETAEYMAIMAQRVYQGTQSPNCMWFRNCRTNRIGASGAWYQYNTIIEFQYNQMR